jgi:hypothetical protein
MDRKYADALLSGFVKSIAIAAGILSVFVFNELSRESRYTKATRAPWLQANHSSLNLGLSVPLSWLRDDGAAEKQIVEGCG